MLDFSNPTADIQKAWFGESAINYRLDQPCRGSLGSTPEVALQLPPGNRRVEFFFNPDTLIT
jgi:hypothetical protein